MVGSSWSSSSSYASSFGSLDEDAVCVVVKPDAVSSSSPSAAEAVKFLCSYGGRILPRRTDGALRYVGGDNRVLSVDRSIHFYELQQKLRDMCGWDGVSVRCQLPTEDLDALVSVTSDDDLANLLDEYDAASKDRLQPLKIRAFLFPTTRPLASSAPAARPAAAPPTMMSGQQQLLLHRKTGSPAAGGGGGGSPTTCASRWWASPPQAADSPRSLARAVAPQQHQTRMMVNVNHHRYLVHNGSRWQ